MSNGAFAIAKDEEAVVFIENACPGDSLEAEVYDKRKDFSYASMTNLIEASELRMENPPCKIHKICGSCQWQHIDYQAQLEFKKQNLVDQFCINHVDYDKEIPDLIGMQEPWNYRNKIIYPVKTVPSTGRLQAGYFKRNTNELINIKYCPIQYSIFDEILEAVKEYATKHEITSQCLRHILLRSNHDNSELLLCLIVRKKELSDKKELKKVLKRTQKKFPAIKTTSINYNDGSTNVIMGKETEIVTGDGFITESFCDIKLQLSTESFFQVNTEIFSKIIDQTKKFVEAGSKILDLYCGIGTISLSLAKAISNLDIHGIEIIEAAVENAKANAKLNGIEANYLCQNVDTSEELDGYDLIIVNPPRKGCNNQILESIANSDCKKLVYVSCNPATLTRDIRKLEKQGFKLEYIQSFDMFPHSFHFESLAVITRL